MRRRNLATFLRGGLGPPGLLKLFEDARRRVTLNGNVRYPSYSRTLEVSPGELEANGPYNINTHEKHMEAAWSYFNELDALCKKSVNKGKGKKAARGNINLDAVKKLVLLAFEGRHSKCFRYFLTLGDSTAYAKLYTMLRKLGRYWKCSQNLVKCAQSEALGGLFGNIEFCAIPRIPARSLTPSHPGSDGRGLLGFLSSIGYQEDDLAGYCRETGQKVPEMEEEFRRLERKELYVHAEIGLVFFYAAHPEFCPAPQIGCSKHACFLCNIFIKHHPHFHVRNTHKKIYVGWGIPNLEAIDEDSWSLYLRDTIQQTIQDMEKAVRFEFLDSPRKRKQVFFPPESSSGVSETVAETVIAETVVGQAKGGLVAGSVEDQTEYIEHLPSGGQRKTITQKGIGKLLGVSIDKYFESSTDESEESFDEEEFNHDIPPATGK